MPSLTQIFATPREIAQYLTPEVQRLLDHDHVAQIVADQLADIEIYAQLTLRQSFVVATVAQCGDKKFVVDGQHRMAAFRILLERAPDAMDVKIPVLVYSVETVQELEDLYRRVSRSVPVHPLEQSENWANARMLLAHLRQKYHPYMSKSERPIAPNMSEKKLKDKLELVTLSGDFVKATETFNEHLKLLLSRTTDENFKIYYNKTCAKPGATCFLTFYRNFEWVDVVARLIEVAPTLAREAVAKFFSTFQLALKPRVRILPLLRQRVWQKRNETLNGHCYCCGGDLMFVNAVCGHVTAHALGGATTLENLEPICAHCNLSMGIQDLEIYRKKLRSQLV